MAAASPSLISHGENEQRDSRGKWNDYIAREEIRLVFRLTRIIY